MAVESGTAPAKVSERCVAVVGMGRSGTSATAGLLVSMGLTGPRPDDLIPASESNERGHWESREMHRCNTRLFAAVGCANDAPPPVTLEWDGVANFESVRDVARRWFAATYDGKPVMVKDPRLCATLPFWREVLPAPMAAVFCLRNPLNVARSLEARDGIPMTLALARWDRYNRSAVAVLDGLPTLVVEYDSMLADPEKGAEDMRRFLESVGVEVTPEAAEAASHHIDAKLRHQDTEVDGYRDMAHIQRQMFDMLVGLKGAHDSWRPPPTFPLPPCGSRTRCNCVGSTRTCAARCASCGRPWRTPWGR